MERSYADFYERSRWQKAKGAFRKIGAWLWGALGFGAILGGYAVAVVNEFAPAPRVAKELVCQWREWRAEPAPGTHFTILISNLAGDGDGSQTNRVREVFLGQRGLDVRSTCRVVVLDALGVSIADAEAGAQTKGRALLEDWNADLLIWGEVKKADRELGLWFLSAESSTLGGPSYSLTEKVTLPENFHADLGAQIEAVAFAQIAPAVEHAGTYLVGLLTPVGAKLEHLIASAPPGLSDEQMTRLRFSLALVAQTIGEQGGENEPLEAALEEYRKILRDWTRERVPLDWAITQNNLGAALWRLGEREDGTERLEEAVTAYRAALGVRTRERVPLQWAITQNNLGTALQTLGAREDGTERLEQAVAAYRAGLEVFQGAGASHYVGIAEANLARAEALLAGRRGASAAE